MWKYPAKRPTALALVLLTAASLLVACSSSSKPRKQPQGSVTVKSNKPGTYQLGDLTITVPAGAVPRDTRLTATKPAALNQQSAPLGAPSVQFDLSFMGGLEPAKPLDIAIPLKGGYLPSGANPAQAMLYTPSADGKGQRLVPAIVDGNNVLHAQLVHLSPKTLSYITDQKLMDTVGIGAPSRLGLLPDCQNAVTTPNGRLVFTEANKGWANKPASDINACLSLDGNDGKLTVSNRGVGYILAVAASSGVKLSSPAVDANEAAIRKIAARLWPEKATQGYLGRGGELTAPLPQSVLPATVELKANPETYFAEIALMSVKMIVGLVAAKAGDELVQAASDALDAPDVVDCVNSALKTVQGQQQPNALDIAQQITSKCTEKVVKLAVSTISWEQLWGRLFTVVQGAMDAYNVLRAFLTGVVMQITGVVRIVVGREAPKCPSDQEFLTVVRAAGTYKEEMRIQPGTKICDSGWAYARVQWYMPADFGGWSDSVHKILKHDGSKWVYVIGGGTAAYSSDEAGDVCRQLPSKIKSKACVPDGN